MNELPPEDRLISLLNDVSEICKDGNIARRDWDDGFLVVGDTHGHLEPTLEILDISEDIGLPVAFLGDYVDRGPEQILNLYSLLEKKLERPDDILLLRGNHEDMWLNQTYGFYSELIDMYSESVFEPLANFYDALPVVSVISDKYFLVHGGISEHILDIDHITSLLPPDYEYQELLWNDPSETVDWFSPNYLRGVYTCFGSMAVEHFLEHNGLDVIIRGHTCFTEGYRWFFNGRLLCIFSAPDYCGNNRGYYAQVRNGEISPMPFFLNTEIVPLEHRDNNPQ